MNSVKTEITRRCTFGSKKKKKKKNKKACQLLSANCITENRVPGGAGTEKTALLHHL